MLDKFRQFKELHAALLAVMRATVVRLGTIPIWAPLVLQLAPQRLIIAERGRQISLETVLPGVSLLVVTMVISPILLVAPVWVFGAEQNGQVKVAFYFVSLK